MGWVQQEAPTPLVAAATTAAVLPPISFSLRGPYAQPVQFREACMDA